MLYNLKKQQNLFFERFRGECDVMHLVMTVRLDALDVVNTSIFLRFLRCTPPSPFVVTATHNSKHYQWKSFDFHLQRCWEKNLNNCIGRSNKKRSTSNVIEMWYLIMRGASSVLDRNVKTYYYFFIKRFVSLQFVWSCFELFFLFNDLLTLGLICNCNWHYTNKISR